MNSDYFSLTIFSQGWVRGKTRGYGVNAVTSLKFRKAAIASFMIFYSGEGDFASLEYAVPMTTGRIPKSSIRRGIFFIIFLRRGGIRFGDWRWGRAAKDRPRAWQRYPLPDIPEATSGQSHSNSQGLLRDPRDRHRRKTPNPGKRLHRS